MCTAPPPPLQWTTENPFIYHRSYLSKFTPVHLFQAECVHFLGTHTYSFSINLKILLNKHESKYKTQLEVLKKMGEFKYMKAVCLTDLDSGILYFSGFICGA